MALHRSASTSKKLSNQGDRLPNFVTNVGRQTAALPEKQIVAYSASQSLFRDLVESFSGIRKVHTQTSSNTKSFPQQGQSQTDSFEEFLRIPARELASHCPNVSDGQLLRRTVKHSPKVKSQSLFPFWTEACLLPNDPTNGRLVPILALEQQPLVFCCCWQAQQSGIPFPTYGQVGRPKHRRYQVFRKQERVQFLRPPNWFQVPLNLGPPHLGPRSKRADVGGEVFENCWVPRSVASCSHLRSWQTRVTVNEITSTTGVRGLRRFIASHQTVLAQANSGVRLNEKSALAY